MKESMVTGTEGTTSSQAGGGSLLSALDPLEQKEMFLKLLVAQLKNQDPTSPMDQKEMMGQMAQFSTVEQMANMASTMQQMMSNAAFGQSISLIGKSVDYLDSSGAVVTDATVASVTHAGGVIKLVLGDGIEITPADVVRVE